MAALERVARNVSGLETESVGITNASRAALEKFRIGAEREGRDCSHRVRFGILLLTIDFQYQRVDNWLPWLGKHWTQSGARIAPEGTEMASVYADRCTVRIRAYVRKDRVVGRIDGPPTEGQNGSQELRLRPDTNGEFALVGRFDMTGHYIPFFPYDLDGIEGIDRWLEQKRKDGFEITAVDAG